MGEKITLTGDTLFKKIHIGIIHSLILLTCIILSGCQKAVVDTPVTGAVQIQQSAAFAATLEWSMYAPFFFWVAVQQPYSNAVKMICGALK